MSDTKTSPGKDRILARRGAKENPSDIVVNAEGMLWDQGLYRGGFDGDFGPGLEKAITLFQEKVNRSLAARSPTPLKPGEGLSVTGKLDEKTYEVAQGITQYNRVQPQIAGLANDDTVHDKAAARGYFEQFSAEGKRKIHEALGRNLDLSGFPSQYDQEVAAKVKPDPLQATKTLLANANPLHTAHPNGMQTIPKAMENAGRKRRPGN